MSHLQYVEAVNGLGSKHAAHKAQSFYVYTENYFELSREPIEASSTQHPAGELAAATGLRCQIMLV